MPTNEQQGRVIQTTGSWYQVQTQSQILQCRLKGKFKIQELDTTNPIAVGDEVIIHTTENNEYVIDEILPRKNYIIRQSPRKQHQRHIIASNIDQFFIIACISQPRTSLGFIDRCIAAAECFHIPVQIIVNKKDILRTKDKRVLDYWLELYQKIGYPIVTISSFSKEDIEQLEVQLTNKTTLIAGHSGVGKSTLLNAINPKLKLKTGNISNKWEKGMHTTTFATLYEVTPKTYVIDTPGIKEFALLHLEPEEVSGYFIDIQQYATKCKYHNCKHINEPECAVLNAVEDGTIAFTRYENYINIIENISAVNYWERK